jgi:glutaminyl-tRNA synthetase
VAHVYLITRYAFPIKCTEVIYADNPDEIVKIQAEYDPSKISKPKVTGHLNLSISYKSI